MQDENGWIKLYRKIQDNDLWLSEKFTKAQAWVDMLLLANHKDNMFYLRGNEIHVKRGQIARSEASLARRWKWSREKVRRFLSFLKTRQQIRQQQSNIINILTIINYSEYQAHKTTDKTTEKQQKNINKNDKNINNEKELQLPDCFNNDVFKKILKEFIFHRKKIKKPMTDLAIEKTIKKLFEMSNGDYDIAIKILEQSIMNGWQGIFELKNNNNSKPKFDWEKVEAEIAEKRAGNKNG